MPRKHRVVIIWGDDYELRTEGDPVVYEFSTQAELSAFMLGVDEAEGYAGYHQFDSVREARAWQKAEKED